MTKDEQNQFLALLGELWPAWAKRELTGENQRIVAGRFAGFVFADAARAARQHRLDDMVGEKGANRPHLGAIISRIGRDVRGTPDRPENDRNELLNLYAQWNKDQPGKWPAPSRQAQDAWVYRGVPTPLQRYIARLCGLIAQSLADRKKCGDAIAIELYNGPTM